MTFAAQKDESSNDKLQKDNAKCSLSDKIEPQQSENREPHVDQYGHGPRASQQSEAASGASGGHDSPDSNCPLLQDPQARLQHDHNSTPQINVDTCSNKLDITVGDINKIIDCLNNNSQAPERLMHLVNRLVPFAMALPGTALAFKNERKILQSMVGSPLYLSKPWRWFVTMSNIDKFEEYLYRWIFNDGNGNVRDGEGHIYTGEAAETFLRELTKAQRTIALRDHPAIATRSFMIKQALIMKYIIIEDSTFGNYFDHWARVEFQRSLSAHIHMLISVDNDGIDELFDEHGNLTRELAELVERTCTAKVR